jgi:peptide-methionine (S)-S-oxide reductase
MATATFGAGCFWGVEVAFHQTKGVTDAVVGYAGGAAADPSYESVCTGRTGHAEVVQVEFDLDIVSYDELLDVFWKNHDPTQMNRQGPDVGTQYRSLILFHSPEQEEAARRSKDALQQSGRVARQIATEIAPFETFYRAEEYHQQYLEKRGLAVCNVPA